MRTTPLPLSRFAGSASLRTMILIPAAAAVLGLTACSEQPAGGAETQKLPEKAAPAAVTNPVERGQYLVTIMVCNDCHTPWKMGDMGPEPDMTRMLSGHPQEMVMTMPTLSEGWMVGIAPTFTSFGGPFGISYSANLTPDPTGLGAVTEEMFTQAIRTGKHYGTGRPILPPMPWQWFRNLTDEDIHAIWAYLQTIPPIQNTVPQPLIAEPPAGM